MSLALFFSITHSRGNVCSLPPPALVADRSGESGEFRRVPLSQRIEILGICCVCGAWRVRGRGGSPKEARKMRRLEKKPIELSVHPRVLAALREDARAAASLLEQQGAEPPLASPIAAWLIGVSLGETARGGTEATRAVGVVRATPGRTLTEDLGAFFFFFFSLVSSPASECMGRAVRASSSSLADGRTLRNDNHQQRRRRRCSPAASRSSAPPPSSFPLPRPLPLPAPRSPTQPRPRRRPLAQRRGGPLPGGTSRSRSTPGAARPCGSAEGSPSRSPRKNTVGPRRRQRRRRTASSSRPPSPRSRALDWSTHGSPSAFRRSAAGPSGSEVGLKGRQRASRSSAVTAPLKTPGTLRSSSTMPAAATARGAPPPPGALLLLLSLPLLPALAPSCSPGTGRRPSRAPSSPPCSRPRTRAPRRRPRCSGRAGGGDALQRRRQSSSPLPPPPARAPPVGAACAGRGSSSWTRWRSIRRPQRRARPLRRCGLPSPGSSGRRWQRRRRQRARRPLLLARSLLCALAPFCSRAFPYS